MKIKFKAMVCIVETNRSFFFYDFDIVRKNYFIYLKYAALFFVAADPHKNQDYYIAGNFLNVDRRPPLQRGLMNFQLPNFQLYNKSLKDWSLGKQLIVFPSYVGTSRFWGNKINCFTRNQPSRHGLLCRVQFTKTIAFCPS